MKNLIQKLGLAALVGLNACGDVEMVYKLEPPKMEEEFDSTCKVENCLTDISELKRGVKQSKEVGGRKYVTELAGINYSIIDRKIVDPFAEVYVNDILHWHGRKEVLGGDVRIGDVKERIYYEGECSRVDDKVQLLVTNLSPDPSHQKKDSIEYCLIEKE